MENITNLIPNEEYLLIRPKHYSGYATSNEEIIDMFKERGINIVEVISDDKVTCWQFICLPEKIKGTKNNGRRNTRRTIVGV